MLMLINVALAVSWNKIKYTNIYLFQVSNMFLASVLALVNFNNPCQNMNKVY